MFSKNLELIYGFSGKQLKFSASAILEFNYSFPEMAQFEY